MLAAMHFRGNEIQLSRVLHAVCQEPPVGHAFVAAAPPHRTFPAARPHRALKISADLRCRDEVGLSADLSAGGLRNRARSLGRVDLLFTAPRFRLLVELKCEPPLVATFGGR